MNIAFIWSRGGPAAWSDPDLEWGIGGSEAMMILYSRAFAAQGHTVTCFSPGGSGEHHGVTWRDVSVVGREPLSFDAAISVRTPEPLCHVDAPIKALLANDQTCPTLPDAVHAGDCNLIITISEYQTALYRLIYPQIPCELYLTSSAGVDIMPDRVPHKGLNCLYSSTPERGLAHLLRLWPRIHAETGADLYITGGFELYGWDAASCEKHGGYIYRLAERTPHATYLGPLSRKDYLKRLSVTDLFTYPSTYSENCCISALEAQAIGLPIVTSNRAALRERVLDGVSGYLVDGEPGDEAYNEAFVRRCCELLHSPTTRERMGREGQRLALAHRYPLLAKGWLARFACL